MYKRGGKVPIRRRGDGQGRSHWSPPGARLAMLDRRSPERERFHDRWNIQGGQGRIPVSYRGGFDLLVSSDSLRGSERRSPFSEPYFPLRCRVPFPASSRNGPALDFGRDVPPRKVRRLPGFQTGIRWNLGEGNPIPSSRQRHACFAFDEDCKKNRFHLGKRSEGRPGHGQDQCPRERPRPPGCHRCDLFGKTRSTWG